MSQVPLAVLVSSAAKQIGKDGLQVFAVTEIEGSSPIIIELRGGLMVERGARWRSESRGGTYTPLGGKRGISTVTGITWGDTDMTLSWDAAFFKLSDLKAANIPTVTTPEDLFAVFTLLQTRGRECLVQVAGLARRGVLRKVEATPGSGYQVDPSTGQVGASAGTNLSVMLGWEWSGDGPVQISSQDFATTSEIAGNLADASAQMGMGLAKSNLLDPSLLDSIRGSIAQVRGGISSLRTTLQKIGSLAQAPASLVNEALAAARSLGNLVNDFDSILHDTADEYLAAGAGIGAITKAKTVVTALAHASAQAAESVVAVFDAVARRRPKVVGVRPGASLADLARQELGSADRWPEIAGLNEIQGQVVPLGVFEVQIPPRGQ